jgi:hypothetical protein
MNVGHGDILTGQGNGMALTASPRLAVCLGAISRKWVKGFLVDARRKKRSLFVFAKGYAVTGQAPWKVANGHTLIREGLPRRSRRVELPGLLRGVPASCLASFGLSQTKASSHGDPRRS